jgi:hypothetical protein
MVMELPYRAEEPTTQLLRYRTDILKSYDGSEHRHALLQEPRVSLEYSYLLEDDEVRHLRADLFNGLEDTWRIPLWHEPFRVTAAVSAGAGSITGAFTNNDIEAGQYAYIDREDGTLGEFIEVQSITATTLTINGVTDGAYPVGSHVYPALSAVLRNMQGIARLPVGLSPFSLTADATEFHPMGGSGASVSSYQSLSLLDRRPLNESPAEELFDKALERIDFGAKLEIFTGRTYADIVQSRMFLVKDRAELQFWEKFCDTVVGMREPFYFPTWREDLVLYEQPTPGGSTIRVLDSPNYEDEWDPSDAHKDLQLETSTDGDIQRRVNSIVDNLDGTLTLTLDSALPATGGFSVSVVSFLERCRLGNDVVRFTHFSNFSVVETTVTTIQPTA